MFHQKIDLLKKSPVEARTAYRMPPKHVPQQLTPFEVGQVKAHVEHGLSAAAIAERVFKADGKTTFGMTAIQNCINKLYANPGWRGERQEGTGPVRKTTLQQDNGIIKWLLAERGKQKVSVPRLRQKFVFLRRLSKSLVYKRLHEANLEWLRRRSTSIVEKQYLQPRIQYCQGVKRKHQSSLEKWAYTDGTVYYLDRSDAEAEQSKRRSLGTHVWRRSENKDAMHQDCLGPSSYSKGQGIPVKVWGMLAMGVLHIHILEEGESMNQMLYAELIEDKFEDWCGNCEYLVCDYESCLRSDLALHALSKTSLKLLDPYPVSSQDFNAMENAWGELRQRLDHTQPTHLETRDEFIKRLKKEVQWLNTHRSKRLWELSTNQKERAKECLEQQPPGGRTSW